MVMARAGSLPIQTSHDRLWHTIRQARVPRSPRCPSRCPSRCCARCDDCLHAEKTVRLKQAVINAALAWQNCNPKNNAAWHGALAALANALDELKSHEEL